MQTESTILRTARHEHERSFAVWVLTLGLLIAAILIGAAMTAGASTAAAATFVDSDRADFQLGTADDGVYVGTSGTGNDGELQLKPDAARGGEAQEFDGAALPLSWDSSPWGVGGTASVGAGALVVDGARAGSTALDRDPGHAIEFAATFTPQASQHVGVGVTYENPPWAIFSTGSGGSLHARTNPGTVLEQDTPITVTNPFDPHRYRIEWTATQVKYLVDGSLDPVATHTVSPPGPLRPLASDFTVGGGALSVYWLRMSPYVGAGSFTSRVFDAGQLARWGDLQASPAVQPGGTGTQIQTRAGNSAQPDGTWSDWQDLGAGGQIRSPDGGYIDTRYIQYRAQLSTKADVRDMLTPTINRVEINYTPRTVTALGPMHAWLGLKNSDDQGTQFDLKVELLKNGAPVASGLRRCITGVTRNANLATEAVVPWDRFDPVSLSPGDVLALQLSTRIGTNADDSKCSGPGGSHANAVGLRLYYDSTGRPSKFDATIDPDSSQGLFLHSNGNLCTSNASTGVTARTLDSSAPTGASPKCVDSAALNFAGGNLWRVIGSWPRAPMP